MKNIKSKNKAVKVLSDQFEHELDRVLPIAMQPNGSIVYKDYFVKRHASGNWALYHLQSKDLVDQFFLKTCALMAAKAHQVANLTKYHEIKMLDNKYWANHTDTLVFENSIKRAKDFDRYCILLTRLEQSKHQAQHFKETISRMFTWSFV